MKNKVILVVILLSLLLLGACGAENSQGNLDANTEASQPENANYLYESQYIVVAETSGWTKKEDMSATDAGDVVFQNGKLNAIVTVVSNENSIEEIKNELKLSFGNIEVIQDSKDYIALKTNRKESIRADIYLEQGEKQTGILIFMVPVAEVEVNQSKIAEFRSSIKFY